MKKKKKKKNARHAVLFEIGQVGADGPGLLEPLAARREHDDRRDGPVVRSSEFDEPCEPVETELRCEDRRSDTVAHRAVKIGAAVEEKGRRPQPARGRLRPCGGEINVDIVHPETHPAKRVEQSVDHGFAKHAQARVREALGSAGLG
jgi:hypothetical protein